MLILMHFVAVGAVGADWVSGTLQRTWLAAAEAEEAADILHKHCTCVLQAAVQRFGL
jgi:hypothetical protein